MPLIETEPISKDDSSEWLSHRCLSDAPDAPSLWDSRHIALETDFANRVWLSKKRNSYDWLTRSPDKHNRSTYDFLCEAQQYAEVKALLCDNPEIRVRSGELRTEFSALAEQWRRDTRHLSHVSKKITHPAFLRIIGMGEAAIPLILEELRDKPAHWFTALRATANTDPSKPDDTPSQARDAWIAWGISRGYIDQHG